MNQIMTSVEFNRLRNVPIVEENRENGDKDSARVLPAYDAHGGATL